MFVDVCGDWYWFFSGYGNVVFCVICDVLGEDVVILGDDYVVDVWLGCVFVVYDF